ncbi:uncharacterized protein [Aristolochia californica]|uniref:uncharacterized protein n=1 Tax=Aristolochia californica TaxID=171875 RepID=UPI0035D68D03
MDPFSKLQFEVGQLAESRTFVSGFRGAWFRCKVKKFDPRRGRKRLGLKYFDFPDERERWTVLYQKIPSGRVNQGEMRLMVRPCYPPLYKESQMPDLCKISETIVIVNDAWKVGDLVDWWCDNCYWSGRVTQLLGDNKLQVGLLEPPNGEGGLYDALCKDLRPSLDWSAEHGWNVPVPKGDGNEAGSPCARLVQPSMQNNENNNIGGDPVENNINRQSDFGNSFSLDVLPSREQNPEASDMEEPSYSGKHLGSNDKVTGNLCEQSDLDTFSGASKRMRVSESEQVTSMAILDSINSSIMDLEELANKIKWLKGVLKFGFGWSNAMKTSWRFLENEK